MSRKEREKKLARLEELEAEKAALIQRRQDRLKPLYRLTRKFLIALFLTVVVLYVGFVINNRITPGA